MFEMAKNWLDMFQEKYPMKGLASWWTWWENRKSHIFRAFKPSLNAPRANLAESGHSSWKNRGLIHLDLLDAARQQWRKRTKPKGHFHEELCRARKTWTSILAMSFLNTWWVGKINLNQSHVRLLLTRRLLTDMIQPASPQQWTSSQTNQQSQLQSKQNDRALYQRPAAKASSEYSTL